MQPNRKKRKKRYLVLPEVNTNQQKEQKKEINKENDGKIAEILEGELFMSNSDAISDFRALKSHGIKYFLNCAIEESAPTKNMLDLLKENKDNFSKEEIDYEINENKINNYLKEIETTNYFGGRYLKLDLENNRDNLISVIEKAHFFINYVLWYKKGKILVYGPPNENESRTASIVISYLMNFQCNKLKNAFDLVKKKFEVMNSSKKLLPNLNYMQQLCEYELSLFPIELGTKSSMNIGQYKTKLLLNAAKRSGKDGKKKKYSRFYQLRDKMKKEMEQEKLKTYFPDFKMLSCDEFSIKFDEIFKKIEELSKNANKDKEKDFILSNEELEEMEELTQYLSNYPDTIEGKKIIFLFDLIQRLEGMLLFPILDVFRIIIMKQCKESKVIYQEKGKKIIEIIMKKSFPELKKKNMKGVFQLHLMFLKNMINFCSDEIMKKIISELSVQILETSKHCLSEEEMTNGVILFYSTKLIKNLMIINSSNDLSVKTLLKEILGKIIEISLKKSNFSKKNKLIFDSLVTLGSLCYKSENEIDDGFKKEVVELVRRITESMKSDNIQINVLINKILVL